MNQASVSAHPISLARYLAHCTILRPDGKIRQNGLRRRHKVVQYGQHQMRQACDLVIEAAHGLKEGDRTLIVGTNTDSMARYKENTR